MKNLNWKLLIKILVTGLAISWVVSQVHLKDIARHIIKVPIPLTIAAILVYNVTRFLGALRLNLFFKQDDIMLSRKENLRLYYKGMFYNLFLPGGIGGDGYKAYYIHNKLHAPIKRVLKSILWDRISGVMAIGFLSFLLVCFMPLPKDYNALKIFLLVYWCYCILLLG